MPRKTLVLIICAVLALSVLCLAACKAPVITKPDEPGTSTKKPETEPASPDEGSFGVYKDGKTVAELSLDAGHVLFDGGIFYDLTEEYNEDSSVGTARFHYLSLADGSDTVLGTVEDIGYEASYVRTELDGVIYTTAVLGDPFTAVGGSSLYLYAFDLKDGTMTAHMLTDYGHPYTSIAVVNGKILVMNFEQEAGPQQTKIYEFDPETGEIRTVLTFTSENDFDGESLRGICAYKGGLAVLRLSLGAEGHELFLDHYDGSYNKVSEMSLTNMIMDVAAKYLVPEDTPSQDSSLVFTFCIEDDRYLMYENSSVVRAVYDLEENKLIAERNDVYEFSTGDGPKLLYNVDYGNEGDRFDVIGFKDGQARTVKITPPGEGYALKSISTSKDGTMLLHLQKDHVKYVFIEKIEFD